jgi:hypothetical protein
MIVFLAMFVGIMCYWVAVSHDRALKSKRQQVIKYLNEIIHQVRIEKYSDIEYWYDEDNQKFLGQGRTAEEVIEVIKSRFPDHVFLIENHGGVCAATDWQFTDFDQIKDFAFLKPERI